MPHAFRAIITAIVLAACESEDGSTSETSAASTSITSATADPTDTATGTSADPTTEGSNTSDPDTGTTGTTGTEAPACGGTVAPECVTDAHEWCSDLAALCDAVGLNLSNNGGTNYCAVVATMCAENTPPCQICAYVASTCSQLGLGAACETAGPECLCRAVAHDLPIDG
jgi:hypothetical protein